MESCRCLDCSHLNLRDNPRHANEGMGKCNLLSKSGEFKTLTFTRDCEKYCRATEDAILKRYSWHEQVLMFRYSMFKRKVGK